MDLTGAATEDTAQWLRPPFVSVARTHMPALIKDPISICRKRVGHTTGGMERQQCTPEKQESRVTPRCGCSLSLGRASRIPRAMHWDRK